MERVGAIVALSSSPSEALRILGESELALDPASGLTPWVRSQNERYREQIRDGRLDGGLWIGPKDEAVGLALWEGPARTGRNVVVFLGDGYRTPAALISFVRAIEAAGRLRSVNGPVPGLADVAVGAALLPLGFTAVERADMVFPETTPTPNVPEVSGRPTRPLQADDEARIARLIERAYADTPIDRWLFAQTPDEQFGDEAAAELLGTGVGTWRPDASFGVEVDGRIVAATLVNELEGPLLSEVMVDPGWRRRGLARRLIARSVAAVRELNLGTLRLVVTIGNDRAELLYHSMGFVPTPVRGSLWLRIPSTKTGAGQGSSR
jgi:ribosomal protein S18 acetylase RimI-like enzyme